MSFKQPIPSPSEDIAREWNLELMLSGEPLKPLEDVELGTSDHPEEGLQPGTSGQK